MTRKRAAALKRVHDAASNGENALVVYFDDTRLVRDLLGDYDANLAVLEDRLNIEAVVNGNAVSLRGPEAARETARAVLEQLYAAIATRGDDRRGRSRRRHPPCAEFRA